jgi:hypothetical protein
MKKILVNTNRASHAGCDMYLRALWGLGGFEVKRSDGLWTCLTNLTAEQAEGWRGMLLAGGVPARAIVIR